MFRIAWQYLTGRCVATDFADRQVAEWPPHPDRVFQALVAAWGERGEDPVERQALEWLEAQDAPALDYPDAHDSPEPVKVYVPVNDLESKKDGNYPDGMLALLPANRGRKERYFPSVFVGDATCSLIWQNAPEADLRIALERLCAEVNRIGHSSSLVRCWVADESVTGRLLPSSARRGAQALRVPSPGRLLALQKNHQKALAKNTYLAPPLALQIAYQPAAGETCPQGAFGSNLLILRQTAGSRFTLRQTQDLCSALRKTLIKGAEEVSARVKELVSGHAAGQTQRLERTHLACLPLSFVGADYADGHLLGLALALPKDITPDEEDELYQVLAAVTKEDKIHLVLGAKGELELTIEERSSPPFALRSESWCQASRFWASVTPIVMDQMQKSRRSDPEGWAADQIIRSCERQGLPRPVDIRISPVSFLQGASTVHEMPALPRKDKSGQLVASHRHYHARIEFPVEVAGPLLLGAGRYRGYGLCKPWRHEAQRSQP